LGMMEGQLRTKRVLALVLPFFENQDFSKNGNLVLLPDCTGRVLGIE